MYQKYFKRLFDIIISCLVLIGLIPIFVVICMILNLLNNGRIFFIQSRPGKNEKEFKLIKFKTMTDERDKEGNLLPNNLRITSIGRFLRNYSLDELPQFMNVLKGEMSVVGPRPLLFKYIPLYSQKQRKRHLVKPGITGWAQVKGRNAISWTHKFELDLFYIENISFKMDVKILLLTLFKVLKSDGINADRHVTMPPFNGVN
jgi:undecaprenyl phosphate N,N'-diacetylbacillosamine 1-phosphate transferase